MNFSECEHEHFPRCKENLSQHPGTSISHIIVVQHSPQPENRALNVVHYYKHFKVYYISKF